MNNLENKELSGYNNLKIKEINQFTEEDLPRLANLMEGEEYDLYIGRENRDRNLKESKWANPFRLRRESDRPLVLAQHIEYMLTRTDLIEDLPELARKTLGCYCFSSAKNKGRECHGHNLIRLFKLYCIQIPKEDE